MCLYAALVCCLQKVGAVQRKRQMRATLYFLSLCLYKNIVTNRHQVVRDCNLLNITISESLISCSDLFLHKDFCSK